MGLMNEKFLDSVRGLCCGSSGRLRVVVAGAGCMWLLNASSAWAQIEEPNDGGEACEWWNMLCWLQQFWFWVLCQLIGLITPPMTRLISVIPDGWVPAIDQVAVFFGFVNSWIALDVGFAILGLVIPFLIIFIVVKFVLKLIPTVG